MEESGGIAVGPMELQKVLIEAEGAEIRRGFIPDARVPGEKRVGRIKGCCGIDLKRVAGFGCGRFLGRVEPDGRVGDEIV